jgi:hypothetical protein
MLALRQSVSAIPLTAKSNNKNYIIKRMMGSVAGIASDYDPDQVHPL